MTENTAHGSEKDPEADDPMQLVGTSAPGNKKYMLRCFVEEFVRMGKGKEQLMKIFESPFYESANNMLERFGRETIEQIVDEVLNEHSGYEYKSTVTNPSPSDTERPREDD